MMAFDVLPTQQYQPRANRSTRARRSLPAPRVRAPRAGIAGALLAVTVLLGLGVGSTALAQVFPDADTPQHEQLHHSRTGCLTPACPR